MSKPFAEFLEWASQVETQPSLLHSELFSDGLYAFSVFVETLDQNETAQDGRRQRRPGHVRPATPHAARRQCGRDGVAGNAGLVQAHG